MRAGRLLSRLLRRRASAIRAGAPAGWHERLLLGGGDAPVIKQCSADPWFETLACRPGCLVPQLRY
jgi:hypothetical protein